jgi:hypothetical protein
MEKGLAAKTASAAFAPHYRSTEPPYPAALDSGQSSWFLMIKRPRKFAELRLQWKDSTLLLKGHFDGISRAVYEYGIASLQVHLSHPDQIYRQKTDRGFVMAILQETRNILIRSLVSSMAVWVVITLFNFQPCGTS